eukprot:3470820-Prorocentrum_lima.AAC.1
MESFSHRGHFRWQKKSSLMAAAGSHNCRDVMGKASAELKSMCNELGIWVYVLDNCFDPLDTPCVQKLA